MYCYYGINLFPSIIFSLKMLYKEAKCIFLPCSCYPQRFCLSHIVLWCNSILSCLWHFGYWRHSKENWWNLRHLVLWKRLMKSTRTAAEYSCVVVRVLLRKQNYNVLNKFSGNLWKHKPAGTTWNRHGSDCLPIVFLP